jgi:hypothetical protein
MPCLAVPFYACTARRCIVSTCGELGKPLAIILASEPNGIKRLGAAIFSFLFAVVVVALVFSPH